MLKSVDLGYLGNSMYLFGEDGVFTMLIYNNIMDISKVTLNIDNLLGTSANKIGHLAQAGGCLIYPSGNFIIFYSPILDEQVAYLTHTS